LAVRRGASDVTAAGSCDECRIFWNDSFESVGIVYFPNSDDDIGRWLGLGMEARDGGGSIVISLFCLKGSRLKGVLTYSIANAGDIRETAIAYFQRSFLLADSTGAAHCNNRDFGTSRWQLTISYTKCPYARKGPRAG